MSWVESQIKIDGCRRCEEASVPNVQVPSENKRHPAYPPPLPTRIFFVSVAPPWGGAYFWDETKSDRVREGLFRALYSATGEDFLSVDDFYRAGYFLVPGVKCPSQIENKDCLPHAAAISNCTHHLHSEMLIASPKRILALGLSAMKAVSLTCGLKIPAKVDEICQNLWWARFDDFLVPIAGTYFPGNNRHRGFNRIQESIRSLLEHEPRFID